MKIGMCTMGLGEWQQQVIVIHVAQLTSESGPDELGHRSAGDMQFLGLSGVNGFGVMCCHLPSCQIRRHVIASQQLEPLFSIYSVCIMGRGVLSTHVIVIALVNPEVIQGQVLTGLEQQRAEKANTFS